MTSRVTAARTEDGRLHGPRHEHACGARRCPAYASADARGDVAAALHLRQWASMPGHDLILLGASAGGVEAVSAVVAGLPADLSAAVCVVIHLRPDAASRLPEILARVAALRVVAARNGMALQPGVVHVCVPDLHLLVEAGEDDQGRVRLVRGPRENRTRPAVDPLFRSAALAFGPRVVGVVLTGALDDGTAGLWAVKDRGGIAVVQDPDDAAVPSMPASALVEVAVDHIAPAHDSGRCSPDWCASPCSRTIRRRASRLTSSSERWASRRSTTLRMRRANATASPRASPAPTAGECCGARRRGATAVPVRGRPRAFRRHAGRDANRSGRGGDVVGAPRTRGQGRARTSS